MICPNCKHETGIDIPEIGAKSLADVIRETKAKYKTTHQTAINFEVGQPVRVITPCQDFTFFNNDVGFVTEVKDSYLGIKVHFCAPIFRTGGTPLSSFNFDPSDLLRIDRIACTVEEPSQ